ncbi:EAL domain protein [compost metagenome]
MFIDAIRRATHNIDLPLIAEMVEHEGEARALRELGIHGVMGRLIGVPAPWPGHRAASHPGCLPSDSPQELG